MAQRLGLMLRRSRAKKKSVFNRGGYRIIELNTGKVILGEHWELDFETVAVWLEEKEKEFERKG